MSANAAVMAVAAGIAIAVLTLLGLLVYGAVSSALAGDWVGAVMLTACLLAYTLVFAGLASLVWRGKP